MWTSWLSLPSTVECCVRLFVPHNKEKKETRKEVTVWYEHSAVCGCTMNALACGHRAPPHWRQKSLLLFFLSAPSVLTNWVKMLTLSPWQWFFGLLAELWLMPPATLVGKCHQTPHTLAASLLHYLLSHYHFSRESGVWNHTQMGITGWHSAEGPQTTILAEVTFTPSSFLYFIYFDYNYASSLWLSNGV